MKRIIQFIFCIAGMTLGFIVNYFMPMQEASIFQFVGILWGIFCLLRMFLLIFSIAEETDSIFEMGQLIGFISTVGGTYYYISQGFAHWFAGLFPTIGVFIIMLIILFSTDMVCNIIDSIKDSIRAKANGYAGFTSEGHDFSLGNNSGNAGSQNNDNSWGFSKSYFKNDLGNVVGEANRYSTSSRVKSSTGISGYTEYKDKYGQTSGSSTTYDLGAGISKTVYKDKNGNETESTSFEW